MEHQWNVIQQTSNTFQTVMPSRTRNSRNKNSRNSHLSEAEKDVLKSCSFNTHSFNNCSNYNGLKKMTCNRYTNIWSLTSDFTLGGWQLAHIYNCLQHPVVTCSQSATFFCQFLFLKNSLKKPIGKLKSPNNCEDLLNNKQKIL